MMDNGISPSPLMPHLQLPVKLTPTDRHICRRLRYRRLILGITQEELAPWAEVTCQQIQKYEAGVSRISTSRLWKLSRALDCPVSYFFDKLDSDEAAARTDGAPDELRLEEEETLSLIHHYFSIKQKHIRQQIIALATAVADNTAAAKP
jgi:transcriptional regulator with XRE-family HTH domain